MLIGRDDISNDNIALGECFSMPGYTRAWFYFALIGGNLTAQSMGSLLLQTTNMVIPIKIPPQSKNDG